MYEMWTLYDTKTGMYKIPAFFRNGAEAERELVNSLIQVLKDNPVNEYTYLDLKYVCVGTYMEEEEINVYEDVNGVSPQHFGPCSPVPDNELTFISLDHYIAKAKSYLEGVTEYD